MNAEAETYELWQAQLTVETWAYKNYKGQEQLYLTLKRNNTTEQDEITIRIGQKNFDAIRNLTGYTIATRAKIKSDDRI